MRRWMTSLALVGAAVLLLAACGTPEAVDGDLLDDWPGFGQPQAFTPPAGICLAQNFTETVYLSAFNPVGCDVAHRVETVHVGAFVTMTATRPRSGSDQLRVAFAECDVRARDYVGGDWRGARLWLGVAMPSPVAWSGGARWFRCDLIELTNVEHDGKAVTRTASLRGALSRDSPLKLGCYSARIDRDRTIDELVATDCGRAHNAEFVGAWLAPPSVAYPDRDVDWLRFYGECRRLVGRYVGVPQDDQLRLRAGVVAVPGEPKRWREGDRGVRCYLWLSDRTVTRSLRGAGVAGLPVRTG